VPAASTTVPFVDRRHRVGREHDLGLAVVDHERELIGAVIVGGRHVRDRQSAGADAAAIGCDRDRDGELRVIRARYARATRGSSLW